MKSNLTTSVKKRVGKYCQPFKTLKMSFNDQFVSKNLYIIRSCNHQENGMKITGVASGNLFLKMAKDRKACLIVLLVYLLTVLTVSLLPFWEQVPWVMMGVIFPLSCHPQIFWNIWRIILKSQEYWHHSTALVNSLLYNSQDPHSCNIKFALRSRYTKDTTHNLCHTTRSREKSLLDCFSKTTIWKVILRPDSQVWFFFKNSGQ